MGTGRVKQLCTDLIIDISELLCLDLVSEASDLSVVVSNNCLDGGRWSQRHAEDVVVAQTHAASRFAGGSSGPHQEVVFENTGRSHGAFSQL